MKTKKDTPQNNEPALKAVLPENGAGGNGADELLIGELLPQELMAIQQVKGRITQHLTEIGHLEVQKAMKLAKLDQLEQEGQRVIQGARTRLGLDENETLQITPDGKIRRLPPNMMQHPGQVPPAAG